MMDSVASCTSFISSRTQQLFRNFFTWLGKNLYLYYCWFLIGGILLTILCTAAGFVYVMFNCDAAIVDGDCDENRSLYLWIPQGSTVWDQYTEIIDRFGTYSSKMSILLSSPDPNENSILLPSNLDISYNIYSSIDNVTLKYEENDRNYKFEDLCLREPPSSPYCESTLSNFFGFFFQENPVLWANETTIETIINIPNAPVGFFLGGFAEDEYGDSDSPVTIITGANSLRFIYELEGSTNETVKSFIFSMFFIASTNSY